jgi:hypothetical protein
MPRGGRRPGAGAPKGNFNGVRSGNHSSRMLMVYLAIINHPDPRALARELLAQGFITPPAMRFNGDLRGAVAYLYRRWFDSPAPIQSNPIKLDQTTALESPPADSGPPAAAANKA